MVILSMLLGLATKPSHVMFVARDERKTFHSNRKHPQTEIKALLQEAIFLATCNATNVVLQVARKNSRVTPHFATAIVVLQVARKVERLSTFRKVARQVACV